MLRRSAFVLTASSTGAAASSSTAASLPDRNTLISQFETWLQRDCNATYKDQLRLNLDATYSRGLIAKKPFRQGMTLASIPMSKAAMTADTLLRTSPFVQAAAPPTFSDVRKVLMTLSVLDPVLHQHVYFAMLLAAERMNPKSFFLPYFEILPHPAVDDAAVMSLHKDVLDPMQLIEWDDHQRLFLTSARELRAIWERRLQRVVAGSSKSSSASPSSAPEFLDAPPPLQVLYWAIRTVLSRMHQLPDRGLTPSNTKLDYSSISTLTILDNQQNALRRWFTSFKGIFLEQGEQAALDYRLVPTLIPLIDLTGHLPSGNVSVEVQPRGEAGSCVELQAVADIAEGEEVGLCLNKSQSVAFTLYRFGFLPM